MNLPNVSHPMTTDQYTRADRALREAEDAIARILERGGPADEAEEMRYAELKGYVTGLQQFFRQDRVARN